MNLQDAIDLLASYGPAEEVASVLHGEQCFGTPTDPEDSPIGHYLSERTGHDIWVNPLDAWDRETDTVVDLPSALIEFEQSFDDGGYAWLARA